MKQKMCSSRIAMFLLPVFLFCFSLSSPVRASMTSTNYRIDWDTLSSGGSDDSSSASYQLRDTIGNTAIGGSDSASYQLAAGYRGGVDDLLLSFSVFPQLESSGVSATIRAGNVVTVDSTTGYSIGDYAALVQDVGASQVSAFGQITGLTGTTLTFDDLADNGTAPTVNGSNDTVYLLEGDAVTFGSMNDGDYAAAIIGFEATVISENGYSVQMFDDGDLRDGAETINDVGGVTVDASSEEYGAQSSDLTIATSTFDTQDTAMTTSPQAVATTNSVAYNDRHFVTLKAAVDADTVNGTYGQTITIIATGNY